MFESATAVRNEIPHSKDSIGAKTRHNHLNEQLLQFKYNADLKLQYDGRNQIDYPRAEILSWT